jgi:hypothetical protein
MNRPPVLAVRALIPIPYHQSDVVLRQGDSQTYAQPRDSPVSTRPAQDHQSARAWDCALHLAQDGPGQGLAYWRARICAVYSFALPASG